MVISKTGSYSWPPQSDRLSVETETRCGNSASTDIEIVDLVDGDPKTACATPYGKSPHNSTDHIRHKERNSVTHIDPWTASAEFGTSG